MGSDGAEPLVNRDAPVPVVQLQPADADGPTQTIVTPRADQDSSHHFSASRLKDKLESLGDNLHREQSAKMGDRMFSLILSQVLPTEDLSDSTPSDHDEPQPRIKDRRSRTYVARPNFSIPTMSSNFRRFNSRIGIAFILQNRLIRLFTWKQPTQTLSFLFVWTFICINPYLLPVLPLAACLFFVMVPAYLVRHPPPPTSLPTDLYPLGGPPLADARTIKPAPELSKDFFRNMRDLQNSMEDFSRAHDAILAFFTPLTNFSNENLSSMLYILLLLTSCSLFISAHLLPWRAIFLLTGYTLTALGHPAVQALLETDDTEQLLSAAEHHSRSTLLTMSKADIELSTTPSTREVEIFELQHRALHNSAGEYTPLLFSPSPYVPLSPARVAGDRPRGTPFFEDVLPPRGWRWADKKWTLDLLSREWVDDRCVTGVEVEVEGERWVTDLHYEVLESGEERERERERDGGGARRHLRGGAGSKGSRDVGEEEREVLRRAWESHRPSRRGEWRRRRWVRGVERIGAGSS